VLLNSLPNVKKAELFTFF